MTSKSTSSNPRSLRGRFNPPEYTSDELREVISGWLVSQANEFDVKAEKMQAQARSWRDIKHTAWLYRSAAELIAGGAT